MFNKVYSIFEVIKFISFQGHFEISTLFSYSLEGKTILVDKYLAKMSLFFLKEAVRSKTDFPEGKTKRRRSRQ